MWPNTHRRILARLWRDATNALRAGLRQRPNITRLRQRSALTICRDAWQWLVSTGDLPRAGLQYELVKPNRRRDGCGPQLTPPRFSAFAMPGWRYNSAMRTPLRKLRQPWLAQHVQVRLAVLAALVGPVLLTTVIAALTVVQYEFLRQIHWHPLHAPTTHWPSGLALGPYGRWMTITFLLCGWLLLVFATGLRHRLRDGWSSRGACGLLILAGLCLMLLAFPINVDGARPRVLANTIHDLAFAVLGLTFLPALLLLTHAFRRDPRWQGHSGGTLLTALLVGPAFTVKGLAFYLFLGAVLVWLEVTALRLRKVRPGRARDTADRASSAGPR